MGGVLARTLELDTYLPPVVVVSLGLLGNDASPEPQVSSDVQSPQALLVPESHTDGLQSLPLTANKDSSVASAPGSRPLRAWDTGIKCPGTTVQTHAPCIGSAVLTTGPPGSTTPPPPNSDF